MCGKSGLGEGPDSSRVTRAFLGEVDLLKALAAGDISYASYAAKLKMQQSQLSAGVFY